jgi:hypothetical protein
MAISIEYLKEPKLQFGKFFEHQDTKTGLAEFGPFGKNVAGLHPSEIKMGFIGTRETIAGAKEWLEECGSEIESENSKTIKAKIKAADSLPSLFGEGIFEDDHIHEPIVRLYKILNRDFIGFSKESEFESCFQMNDRWDRTIRPDEINKTLSIEDKQRRIWELVELFDGQIKSLAETSPIPDIIVLALTPEIVDEAYTVQVTGNFYLNFRRAIKAKAMRWGVPIQLIQRSTVLGKKPKGRKTPLQEKATRAWNFCTAQYYKAQGIPWCPVTVEKDTCFIGVDFYVAQEGKDSLTMRTSVAQAFDYLGQGLVLRGDPFEWNSEANGKSPHMSRDGASRLVSATLKEYVNVRGTPPKRVVVHKSSRFWGSDHGEFNELEGFIEGIQSVFPGCDYDLVTLVRSRVRLFREGQYPPARGSYFCIEDEAHFLYTMGFIPYLETFPGSYVPETWQILERHGSSAPKDLFREVLELTKMNVNNCSFADGTPITLSFSQKIGEIMKHVTDDDVVQASYRFYM